MKSSKSKIIILVTSLLIVLLISLGMVLSINNNLSPDDSSASSIDYLEFDKFERYNNTIDIPINSNYKNRNFEDYLFIDEDANYHYFYVRRDYTNTSTDTIYHMSSSELRIWEDQETLVVDSSSFGIDNFNDFSVVKIKGVYYLFVTFTDYFNTKDTNIYYAYSLDMKSWTTINKPLISFDDTIVSIQSINFKGGKLYIYLTSIGKDLERILISSSDIINESPEIEYRLPYRENGEVVGNTILPFNNYLISIMSNETVDHSYAISLDNGETWSNKKILPSIEDFQNGNVKESIMYEFVMNFNGDLYVSSEGKIITMGLRFITEPSSVYNYKIIYGEFQTKNFNTTKITPSEYNLCGPLDSDNNFIIDTIDLANLVQRFGSSCK